MPVCEGVSEEVADTVEVGVADRDAVDDGVLVSVPAVPVGGEVPVGEGVPICVRGAEGVNVGLGEAVADAVGETETVFFADAPLLSELEGAVAGRGRGGHCASGKSPSCWGCQRRMACWWRWR